MSFSTMQKIKRGKKEIDRREKVLNASLKEKNQHNEKLILLQMPMQYIKSGIIDKTQINHL